MANRLEYEDSIYLRDHANDPINWYPWSKEALERAKEENKPIFISIGYSSCHWCHVMAKETFKNKDVAKFLNENFISIKVDKEERVDIDNYFQELYWQMNQKSGGWPLSIFTTPTLDPIYMATYLPPYRKFGISGFLEIAKEVVELFKSAPLELKNRGDELKNRLKIKGKIQATKVDKRLIDIAILNIKNNFSLKSGGINKAPKFPNSSIFNLLINLFKLKENKELIDMVDLTLKNMVKGGFFDLVDGGFCRYSTDEDWHIPHFEKMLYDNALLIELYSNYFAIKKDERFLEIAKITANFLLDRLFFKNLFFSSIDASNNKGEGGYYFIEYSKVKDLLDKALLKRLNIKKFDEFKGGSICRVDEFEELFDPSIKGALNILKRYREKELEFPRIDNKIITSWNAMTISAFFKLGQFDKKYLDIAKDSLDILLKRVYLSKNLYHYFHFDSTLKGEGFLEDYAYLAKALIDGYRVTLNRDYLDIAYELANLAIKRFFKSGYWFFGGEFDQIESPFDRSYPSSIGVILDVLITLNELKDVRYDNIIFKTIEVNSYNLMRMPVAMAKISNEAIRFLIKDIHISSSKDILEKIEIDTLNYPFILPIEKDISKIEFCYDYSCHLVDNKKALIDEIRKVKKSI